MAKTMRLDGERLRELARIGAEVTLKRLRAEIVAIERAFPELRLPAKRRQVRSALRQLRAPSRREGRRLCHATKGSGRRPRSSATAGGVTTLCAGAPFAPNRPTAGNVTTKKWRVLAVTTRERSTERVRDEIGRSAAAGLARPPSVVACCPVAAHNTRPAWLVV
jgi:hypothetical protein